VIKEKGEKTLKHKHLTTEIQSTWNVKREVTPAITVATDIISKSVTHYLSNIPGKHEMKGVQKTAIMGTAHILHTNIGVQVHSVQHGK